MNVYHAPLSCEVVGSSTSNRFWQGNAVLYLHCEHCRPRTLSGGGRNIFEGYEGVDSFISGGEVIEAVEITEYFIAFIV